MQYCSLTYLVLFLPIVMLVYQLVPKKVRPYVLLAASYIFFFLLSGKLILYCISATLLIHHFGIWLKNNKSDEEIELQNAEDKKSIKKIYQKKRKYILFLGVILLLGMLAYTKYLNFFNININRIFKILNIGIEFKILKILAPIGISFYTLEAISYLVDVYNGKIKAEEKLSHLALYLAYFPTIMEGPIARYQDISESLFAGEGIKYKNMCFGIQRIFFGLMKKLVIADRLNPLVKSIFNGYFELNGGMILAGAIFYTIQLYMDFSGVMDIVIGTSEIFGIKCPDNFKQPFFSKNISDFWSRWHITLGTFFKDYIFYPISLSKPSRKMTSVLRKKIGNHFGPLIAGSIALFAVWLSNGLWHGAGYTYIAFGLYHFFFILLGNIFSPLVLKFYEKTKINKDNIVMKILRIVKTTIIVIFGELIFRADSLTAARRMIKKIFTNFSFDLFTPKSILNLGIDGYDFIIVFVTILIVLVISILKEKNINVRESIASKKVIIRWIIYYALILFVLIFGAYGGNYATVDPMYANF